MYQQIIVAIDTSSLSESVVNEAIKLAKNQKGRLILIHVIDTSLLSEGGMWMGLEQYLLEIKKGALSLLKKMENKVTEAGIKVETRLIEMTHGSSHIADMIIETVKRSEGDLLIIGTHGRRGFRKFLLGSVAENVIRLAITPVLLIRGEEDNNL